MALNGSGERQLYVDLLGKEVPFAVRKHLPCALTGDLYHEVIFLWRYGDQARVGQEVTTRILAETTSVVRS
jgi:hypothetical protein